ncbi:MAG: insulinase family protein [Bacteroidales bacterium]|nr:insulinase family protein [Bacteroidales bacterium]
MIDRSKQPSIIQAENIHLFEPECYALSNGIPVHVFDMGTQDVIKVELIFKAGTWEQDIPFTAVPANLLIKSGTYNLSADQIAEKLDYFGAYLDTHTEKDASAISLYCLNKHLKNTLPIFEDVVKNPQYPEHELDIFKERRLQSLTVNRQKGSFLAREHFQRTLFGETHPYGRTQTEEYIQQLNGNLLKEFHKKYYSASNCYVLVAGKAPKDLLSTLEKHFGSWGKSEIISEKQFILEPSSQKNHFLEKSDALQSAIRIGKPMINRLHPDYKKLQVLNTVLGGYFGSRLMTNIREDKGYTYGIGSAMISLRYGGYFVISSEVGTDNAAATLKEIYHEIEHLQNDLLGDEELNLVRNYMLGSFLRSIDGPFALSDKYRTMLEYGLNFNYYYDSIEAFKTVSATDIRDMAQSYLKRDSLYEVVSGKSY